MAYRYATDELCTVAIATVVSDKDDMDDMSVCTTPHEIAHDLHDHLSYIKLHDTEQTHTYEIVEQLRVLQLEQHPWIRRRLAPAVGTKFYNAISRRMH